MDFTKLLRTSFLLTENLRMTASWVYLWLLGSLSERFVYRAPQENVHVQVAEFQPPDTVKNYFTGAFKVFYTRLTSSHSKAFIYLNSLKTL